MGHNSYKIHREEYDNNRRDEMSNKLRTDNGHFTGDFTQLAIHAKGLEAENARLRAELERTTHAYNVDTEKLQGELELVYDRNEKQRAELEALKPKPVVKVATYYADHHESYPEILESDTVDNPDNLKLTFHDGVLVDAEVIKC